MCLTCPKCGRNSRRPVTVFPWHCSCGAAINEGLNGECVEHRPVESRGGPGTELKKMLSVAEWAGLSLKSADCQCDRRAAEMDANGPEWCAANTETIIGWLRESATERGLPFSAIIARGLIREAIRRAAP